MRAVGGGGGAAAKLPTDAWARVLRFSGEATATATARMVYAAGPVCQAELLASAAGVAEYLHAVPAPTLAEAFAAHQLFGHDSVLARHFSSRRPVVHAYLRGAARPSLSDFAAWLFQCPAIQSLVKPTHRKTSPNALGLSFGIVREPLGWEVSRATKDALAGGEATTDLLRALQGIVREARPGFPYMWAHISASPTIRRPFTYGRDALAISLSNGWSCDMPAGKVAPAELLEPGIIAAFNIPIIAPGDLPGGSMDMLQSAGFVIPHRPSI